MIPEINIGKSYWNATDTTSGGYLNSYINKTTLPTIANNLKKVLGSHLVLRNVLLSSSIGNNANSYQWTTAYCTLPSVGQLTGTFAQNSNKYDDGEANYKLPLFDHMEYWVTGSNFWSRGIYDSSYAWVAYTDGSINNNGAVPAYDVRPLIYIR